MQGIKFRIWDIQNKKMLNLKDIFELPACEIFLGAPEKRSYEVMPYTGIKDKNSKEIHEGDIIRFRDKNLDSEECEVVCFTEGGFGTSDWWLIDIGECEVIGNICENPELIEEKEL
ncbi:hypothetical protein CON22_28020 [Bacillus cereus]|nr:hypothetical protein CON22_28020 [Bacillus cereus]